MASVAIIVVGDQKVLCWVMEGSGVEDYRWEISRVTRIYKVHSSMLVESFGVIDRRYRNGDSGSEV
jgi:hypothetical protein